VDLRTGGRADHLRRWTIPARLHPRRRHYRSFRG
jgi:hypothetical protein